MKSILFYVPMISALLFSLQSCAPVFSELQSARTAGEGNIEVLPSTSTVKYSDTEGTQRYQGQYTIQGAYGVTEYADMRVRYEYVVHDGLGGGTSVFGFGPKIALIKDKVAATLLIGSVFGEEIKQSWQLHSSLVLTVPIKHNIAEINLQPKYIRHLHTKESSYALNIGFSASNNLSVWSFRPENGIFYSESSGHIKQFSIGFSRVFEL